MTNITDLPLESLQHILQFIADEYRTEDLATLLRVNKLLASVTLPYLYGECFRLTYQRMNDQKFHPGFVLTRLLLGCASVASGVELPLLLRLTYGTDAVTGTDNKPTVLARFYFNYLSHVRHLELQHWNLGPFNSQTPIPLEAQSYVQGQDFENQCPMDLLAPSFVKKCATTGSLHQSLFPFILRREVNWTLANPIFEQLLSLTIPVSCVDRYLVAVGRLESLQRLTFVMDERYDYNRWHGEDLAVPQVLAAINARKEKTRRGTVQLVKDHVWLFKNQLREVTYVHGDALGKLSRDNYYQDAQFEVLCALPPLQRPTCILEDRMIYLAAHPFSTNMEHVEQISNLQPLTWGFGTLSEHRHILQRCRTLKRLQTYSLGPDSFKWAVHEKETRMGMRSASDMDWVNRGQASLELEKPAHGLVPLENVEIRAQEAPFMTDVDDIAFAFSQTLKHFIFGIRPRQSIRDIVIRFGQGWHFDLPALTHLTINTDWARLEIDPQLLMRCPNLRRVDFSNEQTEYRYQDVIPCPPALLVHLENLCLFGWTALTFDPATLHSTSKLVYLELTPSPPTMTRFIPPVEELNRVYGLQDEEGGVSADGTNGGWTLEGPEIVPRPRWSWDWHLPQLISLRLTGEFAYRFQFRMLQGCPSLLNLDLMMRRPEGQHIRLLSRSDLFASRPTHPSTLAQEQQQQPRIVVPNLRRLCMVGHWMIDDDLFPEFVSGLFPRLKVLKAQQWGGITLRGVIKTLRTVPNTIASLKMDLPWPSPEQSIKLGIYPRVNEKLSGYGDGIILPTTLCLLGFEYDVLQEPLQNISD
ncbi:hypothetical protein BGZ97_001558 [Linnemannia gamsii]|uniref:F-box domain-containing protein n=1 Tax=Linnemannia gamsii TaxID=64522 RepID=A0A9P6UJ63_9FUNG|nr:hypothetical protein BGZ97_001558 [Linnemannia gamsii]